ncbi:helix-turn-helix transcriptional regulator [Thalassorhabdomicrobium marinisediminis]|uniref:LuxR family transcriptional regulator n=1 Tax=Thalassorhabdomicrobium marinisediminis TaxID=2170577 RepID=A0A2T7FWB8_9RHOB|nr:autoinducer binding domain-containing protein [Thalassorhabdomicrobium marinisediminis]PVA06452.1 LuxR family transcriptional regulator [Thalassorhabdomicrobium marinisediminis]
MSVRQRIDLQTARMTRLAPEGFFYALHIRFALPLLHYQSYPKGWIETYTSQAYALRDPIIAWGFSQTGTTRWSEITLLDPLDILPQARAYGMNYGLAVSVGPMQSRTIASAARHDREFTGPEITAFAALVNDLHNNTEPPTSLTRAQAEALTSVANGDRYAAAAAKLNISESAFKARLASARATLLARTTAEAVQRAKEYRLI